MVEDVAYFGKYIVNTHTLLRLWSWKAWFRICKVEKLALRFYRTYNYVTAKILGGLGFRPDLTAGAYTVPQTANWWGGVGLPLSKNPTPRFGLSALPTLSHVPPLCLPTRATGNSRFKTAKFPREVKPLSHIPGCEAG